MISYKSHIKPYSKRFTLIKIDDEKVVRIDKFVREIIKVKKLEFHHQIDKSSHYKRFFTGTLGEVALEMFLNVKGIVNWGVGESSSFHKADLKSLGLNVGVKTVNYGAFPIIFKENYSDEIIMIRWKKNYIYLCGLAKKDVLNEYQSIDLVKDNRLVLKGTKTGFYGFEHLVQFSSFQELKSITKNF